MSMPRIQQRFSIGHIPIPRTPPQRTIVQFADVLFKKQWERRVATSVALGINTQTGLIELR